MTTTLPAAPATTSRRLTLLKPTGTLTLGNYLGALRPMAQAEGDGTTFVGLADLHALTVAHDPGRLRPLLRETAALLLAAGLTPDRTTLFVQSDVPTHTALAYLLECTAYTGELNRMIQFKEKGRGRPMTRVSLYTYPVLMAADILLYRPERVPVGDDQRQHVELTRDLAVRFNRTYGEVFTVPEIVTPATGARVMNLQEPTTKMGKSDEDGSGIVYLLDDEPTVRRKIARAVTDSETGPGAVRHDPVRKPGVSNLVEIVAACNGITVEEVVGGRTTYADLKALAVEAVLGVLRPLRDRYDEVRAQPGTLDRVYAEGGARCRIETEPVLAAARAAVGLG